MSLLNTGHLRIFCKVGKVSMTINNLGYIPYEFKPETFEKLK